jgi:hypothetical protein
MFDEIKTFFRDQMLATTIRINIALKKAVSAGVSVIQFEPDSNGAIDYMALAQEVLSLEGEAEFAKALAEVSLKSEAAAPVDAPVPTSDTASIQMQGSAPSAQEAVFTLNAPSANEVYIVGDFNNWQRDDTSRLARRENGTWEKKLALSSGRYKYKFVVDGEWVLDSQNADREQNSYGTFDSIVKL